MSHHVIVCGLGRFGAPVVEVLLDEKVPVVVIESNPENHAIEYVRSRGAKVLIADATMGKSLAYASAGKAIALLSLTDDDLVNLQVGLAARQCGIEHVVLRLYDRGMAVSIKKLFGIRHTFSASALSAAHIVKLIRRATQGEQRGEKTA